MVIIKGGAGSFAHSVADRPILGSEAVDSLLGDQLLEREECISVNSMPDNNLANDSASTRSQLRRSSLNVLISMMSEAFECRENNYSNVVHDDGYALKSDLEPNEWIKDSKDAPNTMTVTESSISSYKAYYGDIKHGPYSKKSPIRHIQHLDTPYPTLGYACMTRSSTNKLFTPYKEPEREFRSSMRHFKTLSLDELRSPDFNLLFDQEYSEEEEAKTMAKTMEQYMSKTRTDYGSGELRENTFSGSNNEDANEHIEKVLELVDLFHVPNITVDQLMLRVFPISLSEASSHWLRNEPTGSIKTWEDLKTKFLNKYSPPGQTAKKMEEINNFQQEPDETLYQAWECFKELLKKCSQHYLTDMLKVILFYNGLDVPTRQISDSRGVVPTKTAADAKTAI
ncbi:retrovirus-related pol polyprotein from transposon TNT 1-94 [Tanacetum coccineum]